MRPRLRIKQIDFDTVIGFLYFSVSNISRMMLQFVGIPREVTYSAFIVLLLVFFLKNLNRVEIIDVLYYLVISPIIIIGLVNYSRYIDSSSRLYAIILLFYPSYLFIKLYDKKKMFKVFLASQYYAAFYLFLYYFTSVRFFSKYSLDYGYWIIVPILTFVYLYIKQRKAFYLVAAFVMSITLILAGNRGPLVLGVICSVYMYVVSPKEGATRKNIVRVLVIGVLFLVLVLSSDYWLSLLQKYSGRSRTLQKLIDGSLLESVTRDRLYIRVTSLIEENRNGYGPLASRRILFGYVPYPHSLVYEMQLDYGYVIGAILSGTIIVLGVINLFRYRKTDFRLVVGYIEIVGLGSLFVSSSYYYEIYVPATIALFVSFEQNRHRARKTMTGFLHYNNT